MATLNRWQGIGRLGKDPEVRNLENGSAVANFSIAITESYKDKTTGEKKESTEWINIVAWKGLADIASKYLHKGDQVYVEGKIRTRSYEKDNVTRYITEIILDNMIMLGSKSASVQQSSQNSSYSSTPDNSTDDLPF